MPKRMHSPVLCAQLLFSLFHSLQESIADFLAADGYEVWVIDLRGNGKADKQSRVDMELEWNIDDYLVQVSGHVHLA